MTITQTLSPPNFVSIDEFLDWYPEQSEYRYELHQGVIIKMPKPGGKHSQIAGFLMNQLSWEIRRLNLPYFTPRECLVQGDKNSAYEPDVIVINQEFLENEPRWEKESTLLFGRSIPLIVEVVSTNWSDDYALKLDAYETLGIQEYWLVDYLELGGRKFIGYPKQPTLTIHQLQDGEYQGSQFRDEQLLKSSVLPGLRLTPKQVFTGQG